ncbi:hypothetical protein D3C71_2045180 [compost metagenome]
MKEPCSIRDLILSCMIDPYGVVVLRIQAEPPERWMVAAVVTTVLAAKSNGKSET